MNVLLKFIKFSIVGFTGLIIDFSFTYLFKEVIKVNKYVANAIGFIIAATSNFFINKIWTFNNNYDFTQTQYLTFIGIALMGLAINQTILYLLHKKYEFNFYLSKFLAISIVTVWNFTLNYFFTFI